MKTEIVQGKTDCLCIGSICQLMSIKLRPTCLPFDVIWTDPNHRAISSCTMRSEVQGLMFGPWDVSMTHWMQSFYWLDITKCQCLTERTRAVMGVGMTNMLRNLVPLRCSGAFLETLGGDGLKGVENDLACV